jgi:diguanylate cyclase (GGDEF)-like protein
MAQNDHCDRLLAIIDAQNEIITSELGPEAVMRLVADRTRTLTGADAAVIELADGEEMICTGAAGTAEPHLGTRLRRESTLSGMCVELDRVLRSDYTTDSDRRVDPEPWAGDGAASVICVPLRNGDAPIGALKAYSAPPHHFSTADEQTIELLARLVVAQLAQSPGPNTDPADDGRDPVTELPNRSSYDGRLALEAERARRYRYPLALVLLEIDGLDAVAAELGEPAGDEVLREVASLLNGSRFADEAFRIGDQGFAVLLPHTDRAGAEAAAARISMQISAAAPADGRVTASWGVASGEGHPAALHERADAELLAARDGGRLTSAG